MSKRRYGGDRRGTPWYDSDITPKISREQIDREMRALQEMAPSPTPEQLEQLAREAESDDIKLNGVSLAILERRIAEQDALIVGQRAAIEELRVVFEEVAQGARHLAGRIDGLEQAISDEHIICAEHDTEILKRLTRLTQLVDKGFATVGVFEDSTIVALQALCEQTQDADLDFGEGGLVPGEIL